MVIIPNFKPYFDDREKNNINLVINSRLSSDLLFVDRFEQGLAQYVGRKYAIAVANGTAGLHLLVKYAINKKNGGIVTTPLTFIASANVIRYESKEVIFSDIGEDLLMDANNLDDVLKNRKDISAVIYVDIFGKIPSNKKIKKICDKYKVLLIEDASQAIGSKNGLFSAGQLGHGAVFSFNKNKQITTGGEGGVIVTDNKDIYNFCLSMRDQGRISGENWIKNISVGHNYRMTELQAAMGCAQLEKLDGFLDKRRELVGMYERSLCELRCLSVATGFNDKFRSWFIFYVLVEGVFLKKMIVGELLSAGVECEINYFPPIYKFKAYRGIKFSSTSAENFYKKVIALPLYVEMTKKDVSLITSIIKKCCKKYENTII